MTLKILRSTNSLHGERLEQFIGGGGYREEKCKSIALCKMMNYVKSADQQHLLMLFQSIKKKGDTY